MFSCSIGVLEIYCGSSEQLYDPCKHQTYLLNEILNVKSALQSLTTTFPSQMVGNFAIAVPADSGRMLEYHVDLALLSEP